MPLPCLIGPAYRAAGSTGERVSGQHILSALHQAQILFYVSASVLFIIVVSVSLVAILSIVIGVSSAASIVVLLLWQALIIPTMPAIKLISNVFFMILNIDYASPLT